jgi:hypothetical protein
MIEILKLISENNDKRLLNMVIGLVDDEILNRFHENLTKLNDSELELLVVKLGLVGYSDKRIEQIIKGI